MREHGKIDSILIGILGVFGAVTAFTDITTGFNVGTWLIGHIIVWGIITGLAFYRLPSLLRSWKE